MERYLKNRNFEVRDGSRQVDYLFGDIKMTRKIRDKQSEETKDKSVQDAIAYYKRKAKKIIHKKATNSDEQ